MWAGALMYAFLPPPPSAVCFSCHTFGSVAPDRSPHAAFTWTLYSETILICSESKIRPLVYQGHAIFSFAHTRKSAAG